MKTIRLYFHKLRKYDFKFFFFQIIAAILSIVIGKLIAVFFEKETFAYYILISMVFSFFTSIFSSPIIQSLRFAYTKLSLNSLFSFYRSAYLYILISFIVVFALLGLYDQDFWKYEYFFIGIYLFLQMNFESNMAYINLLGQNKNLSFYNIFSSSISILIILISVYFLKTNSSTVLCTIIILPVFILMIFSFHKNKIFYNFNVLSINDLYNHPWKKEFIKFLKPLFLLPLLSWILNSSDKFILRFFFGDSYLASYAAAYSIGSKLFLVISGPLIIYLNHSTYNILSNKSNHIQFWSVLKKRLVSYFILGLLLVVLTFIFYDLIGEILLSDKYRDAYVLIPFLSFANLILTSFSFLEQVVYATGQTTIIIKHYFLGAFINIVLNLLLIPYYDFYGAIFSFVLALILQFTYLFLMVRKYLLSSLNYEI